MADDRLDRIEAKLDRLLAHLGANGPPSRASNGAASGGGSVASDRDMDSKYGDREIKFDPKRWDGRPQAPIMMSQAPAEYLECFAEFKDWQADRQDEGGEKDDKGRPKSQWSRKDAALARGWARRNAGRSQSAPATNGTARRESEELFGASGGDDDIPF